MHSTFIFGAFSAGICLFLVTPGCSSSSSPSTDDGGESDASANADAHDGAGNCVPPGTPNNELGLGGYCDKAADCPGALCTGLFGAPDGYWFCSKICANGEPCGSGETCATDPARGTACVPNVCIADAGTASDASSD